MWAVSGFILLAALAPASGQVWKFLVYGDSRGTSAGDPVNTNVLKEIVVATTNEKPAFVLFVGDLVYSGSAATFAVWTNIMAPVYRAGIPVYPILGNHDSGGASIFTNIFSSTLPHNGPAGEVCRTYYFVYSNSLVIGLDNYVTAHRVNQTWLDGVLASNYMPHVFVFGHEPAFKMSHTDCLDDYPADRDNFWNSISNAGARMYFCGHDHFYDDVRLDDGDGNPSNDLHQFIVGGGGAPLYADSTYNGVNDDWTPQRVYHDMTNGYLVVDVNRLRVTTTYKRRTGVNTFTAGPTNIAYYVPPQRAVMDEISTTGINFVLHLDNLTPSASNRIERTEDLVAGVWRPAQLFTVVSNTYDWVGSVDSNQVFYRVRSW